MTPFGWLCVGAIVALIVIIGVAAWSDAKDGR